MRKNAYKFAIVLLVAIPLLGTIAAMVLLWNRYVFWTDIALLVTLYILIGFGVTIGYHRMLTHGGFQCSPWLKGLILILGSMAFEGKPSDWTARHTEHHAHSDEEEDPHSPLHGFWHAHLGWIYDMRRPPNVPKYAPHLLNDPVVLFVDRYVAEWMVLSLLIPFLLGGWTGFLWGGAVRVFLLTHATWSVNSICHTFGKRTFATTDESRNHWVVGLLGLGEGWHNNHHAFPQNAFHGLRWWQFDLSGLMIRFLERVGLVWDVQRVPEETVRAKMEGGEDAHHARNALRTQLLDRIRAADGSLQEFFQKSISHSTSVQEQDKVKSLQAHATKRLQEIQHYATAAKNMKKQKMLQYMAEIEHLKASVQAEWQRNTPARS